MIDTVKDKCYGCTACTVVCPLNCISMIDEGEGFLYPMIDKSSCIMCNACELVCPVLNMPSENKEFRTYAAYNRNNDIRQRSSSGGVFSVLAEQILKGEGCVYGASFSSDYQSVYHTRVDAMSELSKLYTSKYMQSRMGKIYKCVKEDLKNNKKVMFSGTPCQIGGLRTYLKKDYDNLVCIDFICHGVPSEKVWKIFTNKLIKKYKHKLDFVNFRSKEDGWSPKLLLLLGKHEYKETQRENLFYQAFLSDLCLRKSCYQCEFKGKKGYSDITIADFWGINEICPEMNDGKGTSLIVVNSDKGSKILEEITEKLVIQEVNDERILEHNRSRVISSKYHPKRDVYMENVNEKNFDRLTINCIGVSNVNRIKLYIKKNLRKIYKIIYKKIEIKDFEEDTL